jgi:hypothetical protein
MRIVQIVTGTVRIEAGTVSAALGTVRNAMWIVQTGMGTAHAAMGAARVAVGIVPLVHGAVQSAVRTTRDADGLTLSPRGVLGQSAPDSCSRIFKQLLSATKEMP